MYFVSITRLRLRSALFLPRFVFHTLKSIRQVRLSNGFKKGALLPDRRLTFWTMTVWDSQSNMRLYVSNGSHVEAMRHLMNWCDEASVVHWEQAHDLMPSWRDADLRMRREGRPSNVTAPSHHHSILSFDQVRPGRAMPISPVRQSS